MASLTRALTNYLTADSWDTAPSEEAGGVHTAFRGENGEWGCYALALEGEQQLIFYSLYPRAIPEERRAEISELVTRANHGLVIGTFELGLDSGEVRFRTSADLEGGEACWPSLIRSLVIHNVLVMDRYVPAFERVLDDGVSAAAAIARVEGDDEGDAAEPVQ